MYFLKEKQMNLCTKNKKKNIHRLAMWLANTSEMGEKAYAEESA